jgi:hypothetical protein
MVRKAIEKHLSAGRLASLREIEAAERESMVEFVKGWKNAAECLAAFPQATLPHERGRQTEAASIQHQWGRKDFQLWWWSSPLPTRKSQSHPPADQKPVPLWVP